MTSAEAKYTSGANGCHRLALVLTALVFCVPANGWSLDTTLDYRDTQQSTRIGGQLFHSFNRRGAIVVRQAGRLRQSWLVEGSFRVTRDDFGSQGIGPSTDAERRTYQPSASLTYKSDRWTTGARGHWVQREVDTVPGVATESQQARYTGWLNADLTNTTKLTSNLAYRRVRDELSGAIGPEQTALSAFVFATQRLGRSVLFDYRFSGTATDLVTRTIRRRQLSHDFKLTGSPQFAGGRGNTYFLGRTRLFSERVEVGTDEELTLLREPSTGRVILDATPEDLDPLEPDQGVPAPDLYDGDRETPTAINIGDSAPVVLEWGGDYRNLQYDFGDTESYASAVLYIDAPLPPLAEANFQWRIFVTDEPAGPGAQAWTEVPPESATVLYREWSDLQGWEVTLAPDVAGRFFKMVNVKRGLTVPDLFVTEMEVFVRDRSEIVGKDSRGQRYEAEARVGYEVTSAWRVAYQTRLERRYFEAGDRNLDKMRHILLSRYSLSRQYQLTARASRNVRWDQRGRDSDTSNYQVSAIRNQSLNLSGALAWDRTENDGRQRKLISDALSLRVRWQAAPRLQIQQTLSVGRNRDVILAKESRSIVMVSRVEGAAIRSVWVGINWSERWVSENLGIGYDRFTETRLDVVWTPAPLISLASRSRYQRRVESVYESRQTLTWSPWRGGAVETTLAGDIYYDSRVAVWEQGARFGLVWKIRPGLLANGSVQIRRQSVGGQTLTPVTSFFHASWSF